MFSRLMLLWCLGFGVGAYSSRLGWTILPTIPAWLLWLIQLGVLVSCTTKLRVWWLSGFSLIVAGALWGLFFQAPAPDRSGVFGPVQVVAHNWQTFGQQIKVLNPETGFYLVRAPDGQPLPEGGFVHCRRLKDARLCRLTPTGWGGGDSAGMRSMILERIQSGLGRFDQRVRSWLQAFVLGEPQALDARLRSMFQETGLLHFLVVSGQHLVLLAWQLRILLLAPLWFVYVTGWLSAAAWYRVKGSMDLVLFAPVAGYAWLVGLDPSCQRALLFFVVFQIARQCAVRQRVFPVLVVALQIHIVMFPCDILTMSSLMSWGAAVILMAWGGMIPGQRQGLWGRIRGIVMLQLPLALMALWLFDRFYRAAFLANIVADLLAVPVFFLSSSLLVLSWLPWDWPLHQGSAIIQGFIQLIRSLHFMELNLFGNPLSTRGIPAIGLMVQVTGVWLVAETLRRLMRASDPRRYF